MTKEITKAIIIQQIQDKFKLREFEPEVFTFAERVVPIYNVEPHLEHAIGMVATESVTETGPLTFFRVPPDERWHLNSYTVVFMAAGAYTVAGVYISRANNYNYFSYLDLAAGQTVSYAVDLPKTLLMESNDYLRANIDGYTSTADLRLYIDVVVEEIR